jgi:peptidoglycan/LPS O-acetylase OafA/YrhL
MAQYRANGVWMASCGGFVDCDKMRAANISNAQKNLTERWRRSMDLGHQNNSADRRMPSLDGLRGIAALVVVFGHAMLTQPFFWVLNFGPFAGHSTNYDWLRTTPLRLLWSSDKAVILFFVLSGFVLALPWINGRQRPYSSFAISRLCRIYLPYCAAMLFAGIFAVALGGQRIPGASDWVNVYGWANYIYRPTIPSTILMLGNDYSTWLDNVTWSLVWEMRVSLLFPLLVIPVIRWGLRGAVIVGAGLWVAFSLSQAADTKFPFASYILGHPHDTFYFAAFFLIGIVLARYRDVLTDLASKGKGLGSIALVIAGSWVWLHNWTIQPEFMKALGAALFLVAAASDGLPRKLLTTIPVQWLGRVSYSLYLIHVPIILIAEYLLYPRLSHVAIVGVAIPTALLVAELFHRSIERPAHELGRYLVQRKAAPKKQGIEAA